jgi:hypothetical protein
MPGLDADPAQSHGTRRWWRCFGDLQGPRYLGRYWYLANQTIRANMAWVGLPSMPDELVNRRFHRKIEDTCWFFSASSHLRTTKRLGK